MAIIPKKNKANLICAKILLYVKNHPPIIDTFSFTLETIIIMEVGVFCVVKMTLNIFMLLILCQLSTIASSCPNFEKWKSLNEFLVNTLILQSIGGILLQVILKIVL